jgi:hypothetical protein
MVINHELVEFNLIVELLIKKRYSVLSHIEKEKGFRSMEMCFVITICLFTKMLNGYL